MKQTISFYLLIFQISFFLLTDAKTLSENFKDLLSTEELLENGVLEDSFNDQLIEFSDESSSESPTDETSTSDETDATLPFSEDTGATSSFSDETDETSPSDITDVTSPYSDGTDETSPSDITDVTSPYSDGTDATSPSDITDVTSPYSDGTDETSPSDITDVTSPYSDGTDATSPSDITDVTSPYSDGTDETSPSDITDVTSPFSDGTDATSSFSDDTDATSSSGETSQVTDSSSPAPTSAAPVTCDPSVSLASSKCNVSNYERCDSATSLCVCNAGYAKPLSSTACIAIDEFEVDVTLSSSSSVNKGHLRDENGVNCTQNQVQEINDDILKSLETSYNNDQIVEDGNSIIEQCIVDGVTEILTAKALLKFKNDSLNEQQIQNISATIQDPANWPADSIYAVDSASQATAVMTTCSEIYCDPYAFCGSNQTQNAHCSCNSTYLDFSPVGLSGQICLPKCESDCNSNGVCVVSTDYKSTSCSCNDPYFTDSCAYNKNVVIGGSVAGGVVLIIIIIIITVCMCKKSKKSKLKESRQTLVEEVQPTYHIPRARV